MIYDNSIIKTIFINIPYTSSEIINPIFNNEKIKYNKIEYYYNKLNNNIFNYFNFCLIRNPWERMLLEYLDNNNEISLYDYIINESIVKDYKSWYTFDNKVMVHYIMKYEDIYNDFSYICGRLGIHNIKLDIIEENIDYKKYYNNKTKDLIFNNFKKEIITYKYEF